MATSTTKFGLENPKLGNTFETSVSKYEYKFIGGRLQPVRIGSVTPSSTGDAIVDTTKKVTADPSQGGSIQAIYEEGSKIPSSIKTKKTATSPTQTTHSTRTINGFLEIYVNGKWIPRTPLTSAESEFPSVSGVKDVDSANKVLGDIQNLDFNNLEALGAPPDKAKLTEDIQSSLDYYSKVLAPEDGRGEFSAEDKLKELRGEFGIGEEEDELNALNAEEEQLMASLRQRKAYQRGKAVTTGVIAGRVSEVERQELERIDFIRRQKQTVYDGLKTKYNTIQQMMDASALDYENAEKKYNTQFSQNLQMMGVIRGVERDALTVEEKARENALASLQIMFNNLEEGGLKFEDLSSEQQEAWQKIETQAGLPMGTIQQVSNRNPEGRIISTSTRTQGGVKYFDAIMRLPDGTFKIETVRLGTTGTAKTGISKINEEIIKQRDAVIKADKSIDQAITDLQLKFGEMSSEQQQAVKDKYFSDIE